MHRNPRLALVVLTALAAMGLLPPAAHASRAQESLVQDDAGLLYSGDARREQTLDELRGLGVDTIRLNVRWNRYAPSPSSKRSRSSTRATPTPTRLGEVDAAVGGAEARGMTVLLTITGPGPAWASRC